MDIHYVIGLIAYILVIIGALNWGMVGAFNLARVFSPGSLGAKVFYILIGVSGIIMQALVKEGKFLQVMISLAMEDTTTLTS